jgi:hypothetical protein
MARGTIAKAEVINTVRSPQWRYSAAMEIGTKMSKPKERIFLIDMKKLGDGRWEVGDGSWELGGVSSVAELRHG